MKRLLAVILVSCFVVTVSAAPPNKYNLMIAPGTLSETSVTLLWDKQTAKDSVVYEVLLNGKWKTSTAKTNSTINGLLPNTSYTVSVRVKQKRAVKELYSLLFKTAAKGKVYNILDFGAKSDSTFINTKQIQKAIDACTAGGTVYIPKGTFLSGALFLTSNMTLHVAEGAVLQGSVDTTDYLPLVKNRFEGWEMYTYASLINAGTLNRDGSYNVKNLRITGGVPLKAVVKNWNWPAKLQEASAAGAD